MAGKIKGITIEIGGDTTKLGKALEDVNKKSKDISSELRQVDRLLKLSPGNTELVAQKQKILAEAVSTTKEKLDTLKEAQKQVQEQFERGEVSEEQYRALQREIIQTEQELKNLEKQLSDVNNKWKAAADNVGAFGDKMTNAGKKFAPISAAAGAAVVGIGALVVKSGQAADELNTLSKQTGISTEDLQKFKYAAGIIDVPLETFTGSLAKLTKNMAGAKDGTGPAAEAFKTLGVSALDVNDNLRDNEEVFYDLVDALATVGNETERDALSMQLFGKSAQDLNPLILGGADALKELGKEAEDAGLIMGQEALDGLNVFNDEIDKTKAKVEAAGMKIGGTFGEILLPMLQGLAEWLQKVAEWFSNLSPGMATFILIVLAVVAGITPLLMIIGAVASGIAALMPIVAGLGTVFAVLTGPIGLIILAIAAVIAIGVLLYKNWDKIIEALKKGWAWLKDVFQKWWEGFKDFWLNLWESVKEGLLAAWEWIKNLFLQYHPIGLVIAHWETIKEFFFALWEFVKQIFSNALAAIGNFVTEKFNAVVSFLTGVKDSIVDVFNRVRDSVVGIWNAIVDGIRGSINRIISAINGMISGLNKIKFTAPSWVPLVGGKSWGVSIPNIPYLAQGGDILRAGAAIVGERGPELLHLPKGAKVEPLSGGAREMKHSGTIRVEGVNDKGQLSAVVDIVIEQLLQEVRA